MHVHASQINPCTQTDALYAAERAAAKRAAERTRKKLLELASEVGGEAVVTSSDWERLIRTSEGKPVQVEILRDRMKQLVLLQVDGKRHKS